MNIKMIQAVTKECSEVDGDLERGGGRVGFTL